MSEEAIKVVQSKTLIIYLGAWNKVAAGRKALTIPTSDAININLEKMSTMLFNKSSSKAGRKGKKQLPSNTVQGREDCNTLRNPFLED